MPVPHRTQYALHWSVFAVTCGDRLAVSVSLSLDLNLLGPRAPTPIRPENQECSFRGGEHPQKPVNGRCFFGEGGKGGASLGEGLPHLIYWKPASPHHQWKHRNRLMVEICTAATPEKNHFGRNSQKKPKMPKNSLIETKMWSNHRAKAVSTNSFNIYFTPSTKQIPYHSKSPCTLGCVHITWAVKCTAAMKCR